MIQAIIFDFDGTILDTETPDYESWRQTYATFGCDLPLDVWAQYIGTTTFNPYQYLESLLGRAIDREAVHKQRKAIDNELIAQQTVLPGVIEYLDEAAAMGLKIGLASSSDHSWVDHHLDRLGLFERFAVISCADDVDNRPKPDPAVYRHAVVQLGVTPNGSLALEDSANGVAAGKDAGLWVTAVPNILTQNLNFDRADIQIKSLTDISLAQLIQQLDV